MVQGERKDGYSAWSGPAGGVGLTTAILGTLTTTVEEVAMDPRKTFLSWPVVRQLTGSAPLGRGSAVTSARTASLTPRTSTADRVVRSVCPYCAVGCGQRVFVKDEQVVQIEGDPDSPVSRGRLCPKGSASEQLVNGKRRQTAMRYRRPFGTEWEPLDLETATDMIADRVVASRARA